MRYYVEVSFAEPIGDGTLTYHLDDNSIEPQEGARAIAQVQSRRLIGYITAIHQQSPEFKTQPLGQILDPVPLFAVASLELARYIARACACNIGEVLHTMLPGGIKQRITRLVRLSEAIDSSGHTALAWLGQQDWVNYQSLLENFPNAAKLAGGWIKDGTIEISHSISTAAGPKIIKVLKLNSAKPINLEELTPKEQLAMQKFMTFSSAPTAALLARAANVSSAPINQLKKKEYLIEVEERVERQVATQQYYQAAAAPPPELSVDQRAVMEIINKTFAGDKKPVLIRGVTCSGKTEVYLRWVEQLLEKKLGAIVLVPEIALTPQMLKRFLDRFGPRVAILHSRLSDGERFDQWEKIRRGICPVVVGARSAVFAPVPRLGTIILDEEGEPSFKQGESPRYHAREVAKKRCEIENALLIMGSATPTIDSYQNCINGQYLLAEMNTRISDRMQPKVKVVDMRHELVTRNNRSIFSQALSNAINETLKQKKQIILYLNRRGFSSFVFCRECGEAVECSKCNVSLVFHAGSQIMRCHYCGEMKTVPKICPKCQSTAIKFFGAGTQRVESEAKRYFPGARIQRLDSDTVSTKGSMEEILDSFDKGQIDILIGTQMVAKGLDFPNVTLVGILAADSLLRIPDFRSSERNFALLAQVSGRAGRGDTPGNVILQTYYPEHHSIRYALTEDYQGFFVDEAKMRKEAVFPPFIELASFIISSTDQGRAQAIATNLYDEIAANTKVDTELIFGPAPASIERLNGRYRFQLLLKMSSLEQLTDVVSEALRKVKKAGDARITVDINPFFMM